jgi:hypothetical protein
VHKLTIFEYCFIVVWVWVCYNGEASNTVDSPFPDILELMATEHGLDSKNAK